MTTEQAEMTTNRNFSRIPQEVNRIQSKQIDINYILNRPDEQNQTNRQDKQNQTDHIRIPQEIDKYDEMQDTTVHNHTLYKKAIEMEQNRKHCHHYLEINLTIRKVPQ
ncbi:leucine rich repeat protein [Lasius niger]|uniref:Leucine rich repeat protein n=1 Tax=Lasius niger TaxID=67767 RepID=A0A0J7MW59_LASNI|nr:leucine rich repeat protein [Lasius niger]